MATTASGPGVDAATGPNADLSMPSSSAYPVGPYGNQVGDTMADFTAAGYSATHVWSTAMKLSDIRANPACKCLVLTIGATWCGACQDEQPDLVSDTTSDPNFCVLGILQEGPSGAVATKTDVDNWENAFHQNFPVMQGNATTEKLMHGYGSEIGLPFSLIIKPGTMTVLENVQGYASNMHSHARSLCGY